MLWMPVAGLFNYQSDTGADRSMVVKGQTTANTSTLPYRQCWNIKKSNLTANNIASDNVSSLYISTTDGKLSSVNITTGNIEWESELGGNIISAAVTDEIETDNTLNTDKKVNENNEHDENKSGLNSKNVYIVTKSQSTVKVRSLSKITGVTNWQTTFENKFFDEKQSAEIFLSGNNLILSGQNGSLAAVKRSDGMLVWTKSINSDLSARPFYLKNMLYLATVTSQLLVVSMESGEIFTTGNVPSPVTAIFADGAGFLFLGNKKGEVYALKVIDHSSRQNFQKNYWKLRTGAEIKNLNLNAGGLLISSSDNFLYLVSPQHGKQKWKKRMDGRIAADPLIIGNSALITTLGSNSAAFINLSDGKTINRLVTETDNYFVTRPVYTGSLILAATLNGISTFSDSAKSCSIL